MSSLAVYGTLITRNPDLSAYKPRVCFVPNHRRIYLPLRYPYIWYPFAIEDDYPGFFALLLEVSTDELREFDRYEGVESGLYVRKRIEVFLKGGKKEICEIYLASSRTIREFNLDKYKNEDPNDRWREEFRKHKWIKKQFPELLWDYKLLSSFIGSQSAK